MTDDTSRSVTIERTALGQHVVRNARGATLRIGAGGTGDDTFTPVELLLAAIGGCTGLDVDYIVSKRAEPAAFTVTVTGDKIRDETGGNRMVNLHVTFDVRFPEGPDGDKARDALPRAAKMSHDRLCTVSRTVQSGSPIGTTIVE
jgi:putative redox protein